jgi:transposase/ribosomal protein L27
MPRYIRSDKIQDNLFVPLKLSDQIIEGTLAHTIEFLVDNKLDLSLFDAKIKNDFTGRPAYNPGIMLKLILFSYANGINSSRRIQNFAQTNLVAMALAENQAPDFTVIADFISGMDQEIGSVFSKILMIADEMKLLGNTVFALDGCKLPSNASKEKSGTFSDLEKKRQKLQEKINSLLDTHKRLDKSKPASKKNTSDAVSKLEKKIRQIECFLDNNGKRIGKRNKESQSNITDNESCKMKTGHGVVQGYNGQAMVDQKHQIIVAAKAFGKGQDHTLLGPMLNESLINYKKLGRKKTFLKGKKVIADTGYFSEENLKVVEDYAIDAYIPDQYFRKRDVRFASKKRFVKKQNTKTCRDDFVFNKKKDVVICPAGKELIASKGALRKMGNFIYKRYHGKKVVCDLCPKRMNCLKTEKSKYRVYQIAVADAERDGIRKMIDKIDTRKGRETYSKRMGIVEPVFANIRIHKRLDHFTLRSQKKVNIQWLLYCTVHNISKISNYGMPKYRK